MSTKRRIVTALAVFTVAAGILTAAEANKPKKVAVLDKPVAQQANKPEPANPPVKVAPPAKKYLPVHSFGGY
jgi:hypothetical protein